MSFRRRTHLPRRIAVFAVMLAALAAGTAAIELSSASASSIDQLNSQLSHQQARQQSLSANIGGLSKLISSLDGQISLVQSRLAAVQGDLARDRVQLAAAQRALARERALLALLRRRLARARMLLSRQLVSSYEGDRPDLVTVVLNSRGFTDLLEKLEFLHRAEQQQQSIILVTRDAKARADAANRRLTKLEAQDRQITEATTLRARAIASMNQLLQSKQAALAKARAVQQAELSASRAQAQRLQGQISKLEAQQAAEAAASSSSSSSSGSVSSGPALGPSNGWAIPWPIVQCESGGQNLPPNSAGASGYYQIIPGTWAAYGGTGPAAYLTSKAEQDAVARRIWAGSGPSAWDCAAIVGIH
jgi:septal ring factor EnvC (AmiA/AmiB activator)